MAIDVSLQSVIIGKPGTPGFVEVSETQLASMNPSEYYGKSLMVVYSAGIAPIPVRSNGINWLKFKDDSVFVPAGANVPVASVSITPSSLNLVEGGTQQLTANVLPSNATNKAVSWASSDATKATVSASGLVAAVAPGTVNISAVTADGGYSSLASVTVTAAVVLPTSVVVTPNPVSLFIGGTQQMVATVLPANSTNKAVTWSSSDTAKATVSGTGLVTAISAGSVNIIATTANGLTSSSTLTASVDPSIPVSVSVSPKTVNLTVGATQQMVSSVSPSTASQTVTWASSDTSKATVSSSGLVTGVAAGSVSITASTSNGKQDTATFTVANPVATIATTYNLANTALYTGQTLRQSSLRMPVTLAGSRKNYGHAFNWWLVTQNVAQGVSGSQNVGGSASVPKVAIEYNGVSKPAYFDRANLVRSATLTDGALTDPAAFVEASDFGLSEFPDGATLLVKFDLLVNSGVTVMPTTDKFFPGFTGTYTAQCLQYDPTATVLSDIDLVGARTVASGTTPVTQNKWFNGYGIGVPGSVAAEGFIGIGDSIPAGYNDDVYPQKFGGGYIARILEKFTKPCAFFNMGSVGRYVAQIMPDTRMLNVAKLCTQGIMNGGTNDMAFGRTADQAAMFASLQSVYSAYKGTGLKNLIVHKVPPMTSSTDNWATSANQTYSVNYEVGGKADQYNNLIAGGPFDLVLNGVSWRDTTDNNKWRTNGSALAYTKDGIHPQKPLNDINATVEYPLISAKIGAA